MAVITKTVGVGGDYATFNEAWNALPTSLVAVAQQWTFQLIGDHALSASLIATKTTNANFYVEITAAAGWNWNDKSKPIRPGLEGNARLSLGAHSFNPPAYTRINNIELVFDGTGYMTLPSSATQEAASWKINATIIYRKVGGMCMYASGYWVPTVTNSYIICEVPTQYGLFRGVGSSDTWFKNPISNCAFIYAPWGTTTLNAVYNTFEGYDPAGYSGATFNNLYLGTDWMLDLAETQWVQASAWSNNSFSNATLPPYDNNYGQTAAQTSITPQSVFRVWSTVKEECDFRPAEGSRNVLGAGLYNASYTTVDCYGDARGTAYTRGPIQNLPVTTYYVGAGGDYPTLEAAWNAVPATLTQPIILAFLPGAHSIPAVCQTNPKTCTATNTLTFTSAPTGKWNDIDKPCRVRENGNAYLVSDGQYIALRNYYIFTDLAFYMPTSGAMACATAADACTIKNLLVEIAANTQLIYMQSVNYTPPKISNCVFYAAASRSGVLGAWDNNFSGSGGTTHRLSNCTFVAYPDIDQTLNLGSINFRGNTGTPIIQINNNLFIGDASAAWKMGTPGSYTSSQTGYNSYTSATNPDSFVSISGGVQVNLDYTAMFGNLSGDPLTLDLRLRQGALALIDAGNTWGNDLTGGLDCYGNPRNATTPARGAMETEFLAGLVLTGNIDIDATLTTSGTVSIAELFEVMQDGSIEFVGTLEISGTIYAGLPRLVLDQIGELMLSGTVGVAGDVLPSTKFTDGLPLGWYIIKVLEEVPNPNFGTPYGQNYFVRWTYLGYDDNDIMLAASGSPDDAYNQLLSIAQSRSQQRPYDGD